VGKEGILNNTDIKLFHRRHQRIETYRLDTAYRMQTLQIWTDDDEMRNTKPNILLRELYYRQEAASWDVLLPQ
jgi:hypothetical protein